jgi:LCP family protein required for cell wall assembly
MPTNLKYENTDTPESFIQSIDTTLHPHTENEFDTDPLMLQGRIAANIIPEKELESIQPAQQSGISFGKIISLIVILACLSFLAFGGTLAYSFINSTNKSLGQGQSQNIFDQTKQFFGSIINPGSRVKINGEEQGRTNILVIGTDSEAGLTDTMMIASYFYKEQKITTVNVPRDTLAFDGSETSKLNAVYNNAIIRSGVEDESKKAITGSEALSTLLGTEFDIPIHYWMVVNFNGLKQMVDELGGIEVDVKKDLYDDLFPNDNYQYVNGSPYVRPAPFFKAGVQTMDGRNSLIYARSRETTSDFDRSERQSIVIQAILQKIKSKGIFENVTKINNYLSILSKNLKTNMRVEELLAFNTIGKDVDLKNNFMRVVWTSENNILCPGNQSLGFGYSITYCDGAIIGKKTQSKYRNKAKAQIQNILQSASETEMLQADIVFVGNQSSETEKAVSAFEKIGFEKIRTNNVYSRIKAATANSTESTKIYIPDARIRDLYTRLTGKPEIKAEVKDSLPAEKKLPKGFEDAQIIVWIE